MKSIIIAALLVCIPAASRAQASWPVVYKDQTVVVALDTASAGQADDGSYLTRTRWDYAKLHALESKRPYMSMTQNVLLKCSPVRLKRLQESFYSANGAVVREGPRANPRDIPYMTWDRVKTGTPASRAFSSACALLKKRARS